MIRKPIYLLLCLLLTTSQAFALETASFSIDLGAGGRLMRENSSEQERQYTLANPDNKMLVLVKVLQFKRDKKAAQFRDRLIEAIRRDAVKRGDNIIDELDNKQSRCDQHSIGYIKTTRNSTNVDFYLLCKRKVIVANYAIEGIDSSHIQAARAVQKTFKLR